MSNFKLLTSLLIATVVLVALALPAFAVSYNPGVTVGRYVKYGNFAISGPGFESFSDYGWQQFEVISVSGQSVTLLSTGEYKNGTALPGNGTTQVWNLQEGTDNGTPLTEGPIIAANLNQGDAIPPPNTYTVNKTESETFLGVTRSVNILDISISTSSYNSTLTYIYDRASGMLLESSSETTTQAQPQPVISTYSYSAIETNIFSSTNRSPIIPESSMQTLLLAAVIVGVIVAIVAIAIFASRKRI